ncbi:MAG TPA: YbaK/EbsC family protein [Drouetiella sp.]
MTQKTNLGPEDVRAYLKQIGLEREVVTLSDSARTAQMAADSIGTSVAQIVKSLIFKGATSGAPILVLASGVNRVDEKKIAALIGEPIKKADADFVRAKTGFAIGGVPPFAHLEQMKTLVDQDLLTFSDIWSAGGHPHAVVNMTPTELMSVCSGQVADIKLLG